MGDPISADMPAAVAAVALAFPPLMPELVGDNTNDGAAGSSAFASTTMPSCMLCVTTRTHTRELMASAAATGSVVSVSVRE